MTSVHDLVSDPKFLLHLIQSSMQQHPEAFFDQDELDMISTNNYVLRVKRSKDSKALELMNDLEEQISIVKKKIVFLKETMLLTDKHDKVKKAKEELLALYNSLDTDTDTDPQDMQGSKNLVVIVKLSEESESFAFIKDRTTLLRKTISIGKEKIVFLKDEMHLDDEDEMVKKAKEELLASKEELLALYEKRQRINN